MSLLTVGNIRNTNQFITHSLRILTAMSHLNEERELLSQGVFLTVHLAVAI